MKNLRKFICGIALLGVGPLSLSSCNKDTTTETVAFQFTTSLLSGRTYVEYGGTPADTDSVKISTNGVEGNRVYKYQSMNDRITINETTGQITSINSVGKANILVTELNSNAKSTLTFDINPFSPKANGGQNYSAASGSNVENRTEILGKLEKYAIDSHLTGITLFENGGYVKYSNRIERPATEYITGYGWGILSEGSLDGVLKGDTNGQYKDYYHSSQTSNTNDINAWNASGSQISDLNGYITSSFWSTRMNQSTKNSYEWYPCLAADTRVENGVTVENKYPMKAAEGSTDDLSTTWRIYVKTDANMSAKGGLKFRSVNPVGNNLPVTLDDYEFAYRMILTGCNGQSRGAEMAGDKTYGIKGAQEFYNKTKSDSADSLAIWNSMKEKGTLGFHTSKDLEDSGYTGAEYIQLELLNEIDEFTAMYTLSSNLVCPTSETFIKSLSNEGTVKAGLVNYGKTGNSSIPMNTLALGAYYLEKWDDTSLAFKQNSDWFEVKDTERPRYQIPGILITNYDAATQDQLYEYFQNGMLDSCGIPIKQIKREMGNADDVGVTLKTEGDSTFKLNVNSCNETRWNELFGPDGSIAKNTTQDEKWGGLKPWMSNDAFLKGLYWSIDRETFALNRGVNPSINYFSNAYLSDPENGVSYNTTQPHLDAIEKYHSQVPYKDPVTGQEGTKDDYGYNYTKAVECFKTAVMQLRGNGLTLGTRAKPTEINIHIRWMYTTDITDYGTEIATYFEKAFNDPAVCDGRVKLVVKQDAVTNWEDVYNKYMMVGQFDLAFGAISGNTYNPLNFMEVLKSDNSSTFTLNWGPDTATIDEKNPIVYNDLKWSFDGLWECADRGGIVKDGSIVKPVENYYFDSAFDTLENGESIIVKLDFASVTGVEFEVYDVQIFDAVNGSNTKVTSFLYDDEGGQLLVEISSTLGKKIANEMRNKINRVGTTSEVHDGDTGYVSDPFKRPNYNKYFTIEIYYKLKVTGFKESQSMITVALTQADQGK